jgi:transcriptional regulator with XRE-family HTH domain
MQVDFSYVSKIETKGKIPAREKIEKAAEAFQLSAEERAEFLGLAETVPSEFERWVVQERPAALNLYRSIQGTPAEQQEDLIRKLIQQIEAETNREPEGA